MNYPRISAKIYREPWCVTASSHADIRRAFEQHGAAFAHDITSALELQPEDEPQSVGPVAVIPIFGVIGKHLSMLETACGGVDLDGTADAIAVAVHDPEVTSILLHFNSPGGTVTGTPELAARIKAAAKVKPVVAYTDNQMCSAAYWLGSQCTAIFASQTADVGSIGVYMALLDESVALAQAGVKVNVVKAGKHKTAGAPFQPLSDEDRARFQAEVDFIYAKFTAAVSEQRPDVDEATMQGQSFNGEQAARNGLTDGVVDSLDEMLEHMTSA